MSAATCRAATCREERFYSEAEADAIQAAMLIMENAGLEVQHVRMFGSEVFSILVMRRVNLPQMDLPTPLAQDEHRLLEEERITGE